MYLNCLYHSWCGINNCLYRTRSGVPTLFIPHHWFVMSQKIAALGRDSNPRPLVSNTSLLSTDLPKLLVRILISHNYKVFILHMEWWTKIVYTTPWENSSHFYYIFVNKLSSAHWSGLNKCLYRSWSGINVYTAPNGRGLAGVV